MKRMGVVFFIVCFAPIVVVNAQNCQTGESCRGVPWRIPDFPPLITPTPFPTQIFTLEFTSTPTGSLTLTGTPTPTLTATETPTRTLTPTRTPTPTGTSTPTRTSTLVPSATATSTHTPTLVVNATMLSEQIATLQSLTNATPVNILSNAPPQDLAGNTSRLFSYFWGIKDVNMGVYTPLIQIAMAWLVTVVGSHLLFTMLPIAMSFIGVLRRVFSFIRQIFKLF